MDTHKDPREYPRFGPASNQFETYRMQQSNYITGFFSAVTLSILRFSSPPHPAMRFQKVIYRFLWSSTDSISCLGTLIECVIIAIKWAKKKKKS